ncbi:hypothetical protein MKX33_02945 [Paenibacillus sp. FSL R5-0490]|nr:hypothetical protein [Paenibacillus sp. BGI2013]
MNNIKTLRSFVSGVESSLLQKEEEVIKKNSMGLLPMIFAFSQLNPDKYKLSDKQIKECINIFEDQVNVVKKDEDDLTKGVSVTIKGKAGVGLNNAMKEINLQKGQINMLYQNSLINLIVFFELLISRVLHTHITKFPEIMSIKDKTLSLEDIRKLGSFEDAEKYLIDQEVEGIMYGSLDKWYKYLTDKVKITISYFQKNKELISEIFQRRNIVVHNDGIVNSIYFKNVNVDLRKDISLGDKINVDREYINKSISIIENVGILILLEMWRKAEKKSQERVDEIMGEGYTLMLDEDWSLAANLYDFCSNEISISAEDKLMSKVNYWLCMKRSGQYEILKKEIEEADFSPYNKKFQLSLLALKNEKEEFFDLLKISMPNDLSVDNLKEWPIFTEIRESEEYNKFIQEVEEPIVKVEFTNNDFLQMNSLEQVEEDIIQSAKNRRYVRKRGRKRGRVRKAISGRRNRTNR